MTPEEISLERSRRLRSAFLDQEFGGAKALLDDNAFGGVIEDKESFLTSSAVAGWAGTALGRRVNPASPEWQGVKDGIARGYFKNQSASNVSDNDMFGMISADYQSQDKVAASARMAAARGESWLGKFRELEVKESGNMIHGRMTNYIGLAREAHDEMAAKVAPYRSTIKTVAEMARNIDTAPDGMDWGAMASELIKVPKEDRPYVLEALSNQAAGEMGDIAAVQSLAKSFDRGLSRYLDSAASSVLGVAMSDIEASAASNPFLTDAQSGEVAATSSILGDYMDLRDDMRDVATGKLAPLKAVQFAGMNISGAVENIPMTIGSFVPYVGTAVTLGSFQRSTYNEIRRSNPTMSRDDANEIANWSAPIQAITEIASDRFLFGKLPNLKRAFTQPIFSTTGALAMFTTRAAISTATEVGEEFAQGVTPLAVQSISKALGEDLPGSDWGGFFSDFAENVPELISTILPLAIVGAGTGQLSDFRAGRQMARSTDMLIAAQYSPESAARISELANAGKWSEAEDAMRIDWAKINTKGVDVSQVKATAQQRLQASERLKALQKEQVNASELLTSSPEYTASVTRTPSGWQVTTGEGTIIPVESAEAARRIAVDLRQVGSQQEADALVGVIDGYYASGKQAETVFTGEDVKGGNAGVFGVRRDVSGAVITARAFNAKAIDTVRAEAEAAGIKTETRGVFAHINGSNEIFPMRVADTAKGILRRMSLYQSQKDGQPQITTFLHEDIESKFMLGLADGAWTEQDVRTAFKALAPAFANAQKPALKAGQTMSDAMESKLSEYTWIENVRKLANGEGDATMLRETFSEMYVRNAYALDRRGKPTGLPAGSISLALEAAVMGANTQEEASAFKRILAMFRAFSAHLKAVFGTVKALVNARDNGTIGEDWDAFVNKVVGIDEVKRDEDLAMNEAQAFMEDSNMPFSISPSFSLRPIDGKSWQHDNDFWELKGTPPLELQDGTPPTVKEIIFLGKGELPKDYLGLTDGHNSSGLSNSFYPIVGFKMSNGSIVADRIRISDHPQVSRNAPRRYDVDIRAWGDDESLLAKKAFRKLIQKHESQVKSQFNQSVAKLLEPLNAPITKKEPDAFIDDPERAVQQVAKLLDIIKEKEANGKEVPTGKLLEKARHENLTKEIPESLFALKNLEELKSRLAQIINAQTQSGQSFSVSVPTSEIDTIPEDLARAEADMKAGGKEWAAKVDLSEPVGVYRGEDGRLKLFDGHHRWLAARERGEPLQVRESVMSGQTFSVSPVSVEGSINSFYDLETKQEMGIGKPVTFNYARNNTPAFRAGKTFGQDIEPAGRFLSPVSESAVNAIDSLEYGKVTFKNPLVLEWVGYGDDGWKARLSKAFGGKTGKPLSRAIAKAGHDGIITVSPTRGGQFATESVDLTMWNQGQSFSISPVTPAQDAEYLAAVESGDMTKAQAMVDEAAKAAGYDIDAHHGARTSFTRFSTPSYFSTTQEYADWFRRAKDGIEPTMRVKLKSGKTVDLNQFGTDPISGKQYLDALQKQVGPLHETLIRGIDYMQSMQDMSGESKVPVWRWTRQIQQKSPSAFYQSGIGLLKQKETLVEDGQVKADAVFLAMLPSQIKSADPVTRDESGKVIPLSQRFNEASPDIRFSISPIRNLNELSDQVERQFAENPVGALEVKSKMIRQFAKYADKWSQERWTPKGNKIRPISDKRTVKSLDKEQAMIKDRLEAEKIAANTEASQALKEAKAEAQAWRDEADAMQKEDWSPKESLVRDLITLEAIVAMFPQEIRGKIGGFVTLARKASESARLKVLQKQLERGQVLLEKHLKEQYGVATNKLLKRFKSQKDKSGRITGKIISTATEQVDYAAEFIDLDVASQAKEQAALEKAVEESESAEEVQDALTKLGIARLFEVWDTKDSAARESAFNWLADTIEQGKLGKKILDEERKAFLTDMRQSAQSSILQGDKLSPGVADNITNLDKGVMKRALLGMRGVLSSSLWTTMQRLELIFGEDSKILNHFFERIINAANLSTDIKRLVEAQKKDALSIIFNSDSKFAHARGIAELQKVKQSGITTRKVIKEEIKLDLETLTKLNDGTMTADVAGLRQDEADAALEEFANNGRKSSVTVERVTDAGTPVERTMSETQGIQWWLWSMQDASRKQMERDGWDADSIKQLEAFLSPEAKALGRWISGSYQDAAGMIDPIYRKLFNAPLPRTKNYSPIHRRNMNTSGDVMDIDGSDMNSGLAAGFTKARVNTTASLVEMDALAVFLAHWENVSHWVSHAEMMRDMKAVLLDNDTAVAIRQKKSEGYLQRLKDDIKTIESNGTSTARELVDISRMWRWFMQFRAYKGLAFRISPIIKQTPALLNPLLADVPAHNYMMGMARAFKEPKVFASDVSAMWSSDIIRRRIESGFSAESRVAMQGTSMTGSQAILAMQAGMMPMQMVDGGWTALGAAISFDYYRRGYLRDNPQMTPEIADSKAIARVEKMIATSAQPSDIYARSLRERSGNLFMRGLAMFVSETRKTLAIELMAIRRLATGKSKNKALDIQRFLVAHFVMAGVSQLSAMVIASLLGDDEDRDREWSVEQWTLALALGPVNGMFVFGKLIDRGGRFLINSDFYQDRFGSGKKLSMFPNDDLSEKAFTDVYRAVVNVNDLFNPEDPDDFINEIDNVSSAVGTVASTFFGPVGGAVDVGANVIRQARKVQERLSD